MDSQQALLIFLCGFLALVLMWLLNSLAQGALLNRFKSVWGIGLTPADEQGEDGVSHAYTILGLTVSEGIAAVIGASQIASDQDGTQVAMVYIGVAVITIGAYFGILMGRNHQQEHRHKYDRHTLLVTRWSVGLSIIFVAVLGYNIWAGNTPGQTRDRELQIKVSHYNFDDGSVPALGIQILVKIDPFIEVFPRVPKTLYLWVDFNRELRKQLKFEDTALYIGKPNKENFGSTRQQPTLPLNIDQDETKVMLVCDELSPNGSYTLELLFASTNEKADVTSLIEQIKRGKLKILYRPTPEK